MQNTNNLSTLDQLILDPAFPLVALIILCLAFVACFLLMIMLLKDKQKLDEYERQNQNFEKKHYPKPQKNE